MTGSSCTFFLFYILYIFFLSKAFTPIIKSISILQIFCEVQIGAGMTVIEQRSNEAHYASSIEEDIHVSFRAMSCRNEQFGVGTHDLHSPSARRQGV